MYQVCFHRGGHIGSRDITTVSGLWRCRRIAQRLADITQCEVSFRVYHYSIPDVCLASGGSVRFESFTPNHAEVALMLARLVREIEKDHDCLETGEPTEVRLQAYANDDWSLRSGDPSYDLDHHGYWGASTVESGMSADAIAAVADALINQVMDSYAESEA